MESVRENFSLSGPLHLTAVDWNNTHHQRSVAASLVQGVYILERDRQLKRDGTEALAPIWWNFFHFQLLRVLVDDVDSSIFGAIYEFTSQDVYHGYLAHNAPKYVIAFRGTLPKLDSMSRDLMLDLQLLRNKLHDSSRFHLAMQAVQDMLAVAGTSNIWLAGHSLGSAIAMLAGKNLVKLGCPLQTYLFNPPFFSAPIERIKDQNLKHGIRFAGSIIKAGISIAVKARQQQQQQQKSQDDSYIVLSSWIPYLFVNPDDHICSEYIGYFEHRKKMEEIGAEEIGRLANRVSLGNLILGSAGKDLEPLHLLPCAYLTINPRPSLDFKQAHGLHQWWNPELNCQSTLYQFR